MTTLRRAIPLVAAAVAVVALGACGSSSKSPTATSAGTGNPATTGQQGGTITVLDVAGGVDSLDPGYWYYQTDYQQLGETTQRELYGWPLNNTSAVPDLATGMPKVSDGGKTLTITIRPNVKYSPPLQTRTVTSADIKYAMERCFNANVGNGYAGAYYSHFVGAPTKLPSSTPTIPGIQTPNPTTLVLKLTQPVGVLATGQALTLPCTTPVPQDYASKYDKGATPSYGEHQVFTGPYMIKGADNGTVPPQGYTANKVLDLVRNPSWSRSTDFRPAYFSEIVIQEGYQPKDASQKILNGQSLLSGDFAAPPPDIAQRYLKSKASQFRVNPSQSIRYIAMNPTIKPLDNPNVRKAIIAVTNRNALVLTRGGKYIGTRGDAHDPAPDARLRAGRRGRRARERLLRQPERQPRAGGVVHEEGRLPVGEVQRAGAVGRRRQRLSGQGVGRGVRPAGQAARVQRAADRGAAQDDVLEVLPGSQEPARVLPEHGLGQGLLRFTVGARSIAQRGQHRRLGQHEHGEVNNRSSTRPSPRRRS